MKTHSLVLAVLGFAVFLLYTPAAYAECSCLCIDGEPFLACSGFIESITTTDECTAALDCAEVGDAEPDGPPGFVCRSRNVYDVRTGKHQPKHVCHPKEVAQHGVQN